MEHRHQHGVAAADARPFVPVFAPFPLDQAGGLVSDPVTPEPMLPHMTMSTMSLELTDDEESEVIQVVSDADGEDGVWEGGGPGAAVTLPTEPGGGITAAAAINAGAFAGEASQLSKTVASSGSAAEEDSRESASELVDSLGTARRKRHSSWAPPPSCPWLDDHAEEEVAGGENTTDGPSPFLVALADSPSHGSDDDDGMGDPTSDSDDLVTSDNPNFVHLSPAEYAVVQAQQVAPDDLELFLRLCPYFRGKHKLEEIMYRENLNRAQLVDILKKFSAVVRTVTL